MLMGLAELIAAIPDGLSVQAGLNPEGFELSRPLATLEFLLRNSMDQLLAMAAAAAAEELPPTPERGPLRRAAPPAP